jgi:hypothetical protein
MFGSTAVSATVINRKMKESRPRAASVLHRAGHPATPPIAKSGTSQFDHLALLGQFFIGYQVTFVGSLVGFAYGFASGFLIGYFVAVTYNWPVGLRNP